MIWPSACHREFDREPVGPFQFTCSDPLVYEVREDLDEAIGLFLRYALPARPNHHALLKDSWGAIVLNHYSRWEHPPYWAGCAKGFDKLREAGLNIADVAFWEAEAKVRNGG